MEGKKARKEKRIALGNKLKKSGIKLLVVILVVVILFYSGVNAETIGAGLGAYVGLSIFRFFVIRKTRKKK